MQCKGVSYAGINASSRGNASVFRSYSLGRKRYVYLSRGLNPFNTMDLLTQQFSHAIAQLYLDDVITEKEYNELASLFRSLYHNN